MNKLAILLVGILASFATHADIITCGFTEPFITSTYSMAQQSLTYKDDVRNVIKVITGVSFQIKGPGQFELLDKNLNVLQKLNLDYKGSNGMSDIDYPYSVENFYQDAGFPHAVETTGCESNFLKGVPVKE